MEHSSIEPASISYSADSLLISADKLISVELPSSQVGKSSEESIINSSELSHVTFESINLEKILLF
jgi:hypothetical protein